MIRKIETERFSLTTSKAFNKVTAGVNAAIGHPDMAELLWEGLADEWPGPEEEFRNFELTSRLRKCTALLSPTLRRTFQLRVMDGLSIFETARVLGLPHGMIKA